MADRRLALRFDGPEPVRQQEAHFAQGALFVPVPDPAPEPQSRVALLLISPYGDEIEAEAFVVQVFPDTGMALTLTDASANEQLHSLFAAARDATGQGGELSVTWEEPGDDDDKTGTLLDQIRAMGTTEKRTLALHGTRGERLLLAKDTNKTLQAFLLKNPRITLDEVRALAGSRQANPDALKMISENRGWMQSTGVVSALVRNPKTPTPLAVRLLDRLPITEIRQIAKASSASMAVVQAAKRKVLGGR